MIISDREKLLHLIFTERVVKSDAIVLLEGDGYARVQTAIDLYHDGYAPRIIFSGGITNYSYGSYPFSDVLPLLKEGGVPESAVIHESKSQHTKQQAIEVVKLALKHNWHRLILVATPHHQLRAYLTFLKQIGDKKQDLLLVNFSARNVEWYSENEWGKRFDLLNQEFERIEMYTQNGDLATIEEALKYQKWKEKQILP